MFNRDTLYIQFNNPPNLVAAAKKLYEVADYVAKKGFRTVEVVFEGKSRHEFSTINDLVAFADELLTVPSACC